MYEPGDSERRAKSGSGTPTCRLGQSDSRSKSEPDDRHTGRQSAFAAYAQLWKFSPHVEFSCSLLFLQATDLAYVSSSYRASKAVAGIGVITNFSSPSMLSTVSTQHIERLLVTADKSKQAPQPLQDVTKLKVIPSRSEQEPSTKRVLPKHTRHSIGSCRCQSLAIVMIYLTLSSCCRI